MKINQAIKQDNFSSYGLKATVNLMYTSNWLRDQLNDVYLEFDILFQHFNILKIIKGQSPNPASPSYIKEVMVDKGCDLTRIVDKLVKLNYVVRSQNSLNRRIIEIKITQKGIEVADKIQDNINIKIKKTIALSEDECNELSNLLDKLRIG